MTVSEPEVEVEVEAKGRFGKRYAPGERIFRTGEPAEEAYFVRVGRVRLVIESGGTERSLRVVLPGELFGEQALIPGTPRNCTAVALVETEVVPIDAGSFEELLAGNPAVGVGVVGQLVRRLREAESQLEVLHLPDAQGRVVAALLQVAEAERAEHPQSDGTIDFSMAPLELSARAGLDVETVKRTVQQLRSGGYVRIENERVILPDVGALRELGQLLQRKHEIAVGSEPALRRGRPEP